MTASLDITFLGTGTSHGIPMIGCDCPVCRSTDDRDRRNRTSVAVTGAADRVLLIDVPPEFRLAAVATGLPRVDAVLLTHSHADHIMGMDDLRRYNHIIGRAIDCYGDADTIATTRGIFSYAERPYVNPDRPSLAFVAIDGPTRIAALDVIPIPLIHDQRTIFGYRIGRFAYCTDCSAIPESSFDLLGDLDLLVLDALRHTPHPAHFNVEQALAAVERIAPRRTLFTHIAHEISHAATSAELPDGVELAYDGLRVRARMTGDGEGEC